MKRIVLALAFGLAAAACNTTSKPTMNIVNASAGMGHDASAVGSAIETSLVGLGFKVIDKTPNLITARIELRGKHSATVRIPYTDKSYSIEYVDSSGLNYDAKSGSIHHNYNRWVGNLRLAIDRQLGTATK